jgi:hypothetical protein
MHGAESIRKATISNAFWSITIGALVGCFAKVVANFADQTSIVTMQLTAPCQNITIDNT